ncbi:MAG: hypothetical protein WCR42_11720 [bacterium]
MKKYILSLFLIFFALSLNAQDPGDSVIVKDAFLGHIYYIDSNKVSRDVVSYIVGSDRQTQKLLRVSRIQRSVGKIALCVGAISTVFVFLNAGTISYNSSYRVSSLADMNIYAVIGALGGLSFGILELYESNWRFQKAINIYNSDISIPKKTTELNLNLGLNYLNLTYRF